MEPGTEVAPKMRRWLTAWLAYREERGIVTIRNNEQHMRLYILPAVDGRHVADWTPADMRALVADLDARISGGTMGAKSAANVWATAKAAARAA